MEGNLEHNRLHTICQEACCANQGECFSRGVARSSSSGRSACAAALLAVDSGTPSALDADRPLRLAEGEAAGPAVCRRHLRDEDDLSDGGAGHFARLIEVMRWERPGVGIEVLSPTSRVLARPQDRRRRLPAVRVETLRRCPGSLRRPPPRPITVGPSKCSGRPRPCTRRSPPSRGSMVGLGNARGCPRGHGRPPLGLVRRDHHREYLAPAAHHPVVEYVKPEIFEKCHRDGLRLGFRDAASGPFVSSYMAEKYYKKPGKRDEG